MEFVNALKSTLRKFPIYITLELDVMVMLEGIKGLRQFRVVGNGDFGSEVMVVKDSGRNTATSGGS